MILNPKTKDLSMKNFFIIITIIAFHCSQCLFSMQQNQFPMKRKNSEDIRPSKKYKASQPTLIASSILSAYYINEYMKLNDVGLLEQRANNPFINYIATTLETNIKLYGTENYLNEDYKMTPAFQKDPNYEPNFHAPTKRCLFPDENNLFFNDDDTN